MSAEKPTFDAASHERLLRTLSDSEYVERYLDICTKYKVSRDIDGPRLDMAKTAEIFRSNGVTLHWDKKFKVFAFDREEVSDWSWEAKLVVQRYDSLEPMLSGRHDGRAVGSTWLDLAFEAGKLRHPPMPHTAFLPPVVPVNRPQFDGDMRTMERMVPDLIELFRWTKRLVRYSWPAQPATVKSRSPAEAFSR